MTPENVYSLFDSMVPADLKHEASIKEENYTINAKSICDYFKSCGKKVTIEKMKQWMNEGGKEAGIDDFSGDKEIDDSTFYDFLTSFCDD